MKYVLVNGAFVIRDGELDAAVFHGRPVRRNVVHRQGAQRCRFLVCEMRFEMLTTNMALGHFNFSELVVLKAVADVAPRLSSLPKRASNRSEPSTSRAAVA